MKELLIDLRQRRKNYRKMIEFCCDNLVLNNTIIEVVGFDKFEIYCGEIMYYQDEDGNELSYDEYVNLLESNTWAEEFMIDAYQYYIISERDAERLREYTNEIVLYCEDLDLYLLYVTHYGTSWDYVASNWKEVE